MAKKTTTGTKTTPSGASKKTAAPKKTTRKKKAATKQSRGAESPTTLDAKVDIGFGNTLYIRGKGPGLSWERGVPMECLASDEWVWSANSSFGPLVCKVLINDEIWSTGEDFRVPQGQRLVCYPAF